MNDTTRAQQDGQEPTSRRPTPLDLPRPISTGTGPRSSLAKGRALHLLDIENLLGSPRFTKSEVIALQDRYRAVAKPGPASILVAATSSSTGVITTGLAWPAIRHGWRPGHDGADLMLLDVLREERVAERFETVVIASGDGIFAAPAADLRALGVEVTVVARTDALSETLRHAVGTDHIITLTIGDDHECA